MKMKSILSGLIALCAVCIFSAATYSQSPQIGITTSRTQALVAVALGLISLAIGGLALRSAGRIGTGTGRAGAIAALVLGPIGLVIGALIVATAQGGLGTGNGLGGGIVAMIVGLIGMALGGLGLARRQMPSTRNEAATSTIERDTMAKQTRPTRTLLVCGIVGGPMYVMVTMAQALTRDGFDLSQHRFSWLTTGDLGWIHQVNMVMVGVLTVLFAFGVRPVLRTGRGAVWGPRL